MVVKEYTSEFPDRKTPLEFWVPKVLCTFADEKGAECAPFSRLPTLNKKIEVGQDGS